MAANCDVIFIFAIYRQFGALRKSDSGPIVNKKLTFSLTVTFYLTKSENRTKKSLTQLSLCCFEKVKVLFLLKGTIFAKKCCFFKKMLTSAKLR